MTVVIVMLFPFVWFVMFVYDYTFCRYNLFSNFSMADDELYGLWMSIVEVLMLNVNGSMDLFHAGGHPRFGFGSNLSLPCLFMPPKKEIHDEI